MADTNATDDPDVERYFNDGTDRYDEDLYHAAKRIAAGQALTVAELDAVKSKVNKRSGDDISLLPLALWKKNAAAFDQLLSIGADPTLPLKLTGEHVYDSVLMGIAREASRSQPSFCACTSSTAEVRTLGWASTRIPSLNPRQRWKTSKAISC